MRVSSSAPSGGETLAAVGHRIHTTFAALWADDRALKLGNASQASLRNESQRFGLWARDLGLFGEGHSSLDYRFRDAPSVYDYTHQLLGTLERSLSTIKDELDYENLNEGAKKLDVRSAEQSGHRDVVQQTVQAPHEHQTSNESSDEEDSLLSYQKNSNAAIVLENARLIIDTLYKLSFKIRDPATRVGFSKARAYRQMDEDTGVDLMDAFLIFDLRHVAETFGYYQQVPPSKCENHFLVQRLARANTRRRQQFGQWQKHMRKLGRLNHAPAQLSPDAQPIVVPSNERGLPSLPSTATKLEESKIDLDDCASIRTASTAVLSKEDEEADVHIPPLPKELCAKNEFECPYCHIICAKRTSNQSAWVRHVLRDLRPYVCTYEDCTESDQQYDNMKDWLNHENNLHRGPKQQMYDPSKQPSDLHDPRQDLGVSLPNPRYPNRLYPDISWRDECPICLKSYPSFSHAALHLQKIAIFALPALTGFGESTLPGDQDSNVANIDDQKSVSSKSSFEKGDKDDIHENETNENLSDSDDMHENETKDTLKDSGSRTSRDAVPLSKTGQEIIQRLENSLQQTRNSTGKEIDLNASNAALKPDSALLYRGYSNKNSPTSVIGHVSRTQLSFFARIESLEPNYQAQAVRDGPHWAPPNIKTGFTRRAVHLFRWFGGVMTTVTASDPVIGSIFDAATIFTQNPDTPHLLVVPFDAQKTHPYQNNGGWKPLYFHHIRINSTQRTYSAVSAVGDRQNIAAPGLPHWMPQLLPKIYDFQTGSPRIQAGLIGSLPLLIALAAFSAPPPALATVLTNSLRPGMWRPHQYQYPAGHIAERGMVVTVFFDPANPQGSNAGVLNNLQNGGLGPFYS